MFNAAERRFIFWKVSPEDARKRAEEADAKKAEKRAIEMNRKIRESAVSVSYGLTRELAGMRGSPAALLRATEREFVSKIEINEANVAKDHEATNDERAYNSRLFAIAAISYLDPKIERARPETRQSLARFTRDVSAWALRRTEELTGDQVDFKWSVNVLGKVLANRLPPLDAQVFLDNPPSPRNSFDFYPQT
jgi:hypothetical protein